MLGNIEINQIEAALKTSIKQNEIAGANVLVMKDGREIYYYEEGFADREAKLPIKRDSIFRLYSMSKPVTAAAVMILLERGLIDLYEPVSKYLEGFKDQMVDQEGCLVPANREVNLKDLLTMTSGLVYPGEGKSGQDTAELFAEIDLRLFGAHPMDTIEVANKLGKCTLAFQPGASWQYGTSADVLGAIVEVVSGQKFGEFLKQEIFEPLGMKDTGFFVSAEKANRLVKTYEEDGKGDLIYYTGNHLGIINRMDRQPAFESGGAGLVSTIDDYARFASMLLNKGSLDGVQILRPKTVQYLTSASLSSAQQRGFDNWLTLNGHSYGNLMRVLTDDARTGTIGSAGEYGWDGWLGAYFKNSPSDNLTFVYMMQKTNTGTTPLTRKLRNIVFSSCCD